MVTRRRCCQTARCSSQAALTRDGFSRARNSTIRRAGAGRPPAASPPRASCTRRRCCPTARCSSQEVLATAQSRERGTLRLGERDLDGHRQPRHRTLESHGDVAAQRQGARCGRYNWRSAGFSRARNSTMSASDSAATGSLKITTAKLTVRQTPLAHRLAFPRHLASFRRQHPGSIEQLSDRAIAQHRQQRGCFPSRRSNPRAGRIQASLLCR